MGYTLAAALKRLGAESGVVVAELVPAVVVWNRGPLADLAGRPLDDHRVWFEKSTSRRFSDRGIGTTTSSCWTWTMAPGA